MTPFPRKTAALAVVMAAASLAIAGCGGGSSASTTPNVDTQAMQQFQDCLSQQGVQAPQDGAPPSGGLPPNGQPPSGGIPGGQPSKKMQKAFQACQQYAPQGGFPGAPPTQ
jgi:hypothetical protein